MPDDCDGTIIHLTCFPGCVWLCANGKCHLKELEALSLPACANKEVHPTQPLLPFMIGWVDQTLEMY